jgi:hypothetical protein
VTLAAGARGRPLAALRRDAREGAHDDLVLALAIALFVSEQPMAKWLPVDEMHELWRQNGWQPKPAFQPHRWRFGM